MSFGDHLRGLREAAGLSRAALARRAAVPAGTLRNWEAGRGFPGPRLREPGRGPGGDPGSDSPEGVDDPGEDEALAAQEESRRGRDGRVP
jgi:hypothetical protein